MDQIKIIKNMLAKDLYIVKKELPGTLIDVMVWPTVASIVFGYIMPKLSSVGEGYGAFVLIGSIITIATVTALDTASQVVSDLETNRIIDFNLSLPINPRLVFVQKALFITLKCMLNTVPIFFWGKLVLGSKFDLSNLSLLKFSIFYPMINLFIGFFAIWIVSWVKSQKTFIHVWLRMYNPMMWFGGQMFSWKQASEHFGLISSLMLLNPITYCVEGLHAAVLGQEGFINFWVCFLMLIIFTFVVGTLGVQNLTKRLDCA